jgi:hypothetical protein
LRKQELSTESILYQGALFVHLLAVETRSFPYLGVRASILACPSRNRKWKAKSFPNLAAETTHVLSATKELVGVAKQHHHLLGQMVLSMQMVASARFRYSVGLVPWTDAELDRVHKVWLQVQQPL